jgi:hypothetical protein
MPTSTPAVGGAPTETFDVLFVHEASVLHKRQRKPRPVILAERAEVTIPHVSIGAAPVALRYPDPMARDGKLRELRWTGDRLVTAVEDADGGPVTLDLARQLAARGDGPFRGALDWQHRAARPTDDPSLAEARIVDMPNREWSLAVVRARAERLVLVDGILHVAAEEPVYLVHHSPWAPAVHIMVTTAADAMHRKAAAAFRADRLQAAIAHARRPVPGGLASERAVFHSAIEVLRPEALRFDDRAVAVRRIAAELLDCVAGDLAQAGLPAMAAYVALRDLCRGQDGGSDELAATVLGLLDAAAADAALGHATWHETWAGIWREQLAAWG